MHVLAERYSFQIKINWWLVLRLRGRDGLSTFFAAILVKRRVLRCAGDVFVAFVFTKLKVGVCWGVIDSDVYLPRLDGHVLRSTSSYRADR